MQAEELVAYHLHPDEAEQQAQAIAQQPELVGDIAEQEEERTQAHDGKDVGEEDNIGVGGDGEDGGNAVDSKDDVGEFNHHQNQEEGGHKPTAIEMYRSKRT